MATLEIRMVEGWSVSLTEYEDAALHWKATATQFFDYNWATGTDASMALTSLADRIGLDRQAMLAAFGLTT